MTTESRTGPMPSQGGRVFMGRDPEFTKGYYAFKALQNETDNLLDILPNETYPDELAQMRADWWAVGDGGLASEHLNILKKDIEQFLRKVGKFRLRYLFPESKLRAYAAGEYGQAVFGGPLPSNIRGAHLRHVAELLERYPNLQMGYTAQEVGIYFAVNASGSVAMGVESVSSAAVCAVVLWLEPATVRCFREAFDRLWKNAVTDKQRFVTFLGFLANRLCL